MKNFIKKFFLINDSPHKIAAGAALGVFLGIAPGAGVAATLVLTSVFRFNRLAAITGALATNTWTLIFALPLAATVGGCLFGEKRTSLIEQFNQVYSIGFKFLLSKQMVFDIVLPLSVGFAIVSGVIALFFYALIYSLIKMHRKTTTGKAIDCLD